MDSRRYAFSVKWLQQHTGMGQICSYLNVFYDLVHEALHDNRCLEQGYFDVY